MSLLSPLSHPEEDVLILFDELLENDDADLGWAQFTTTSKKSCAVGLETAANGISQWQIFVMIQDTPSNISAYCNFCFFLREEIFTGIVFNFDRKNSKPLEMENAKTKKGSQPPQWEECCWCEENSSPEANSHKTDRKFRWKIWSRFWTRYWRIGNSHVLQKCCMWTLNSFILTQKLFRANVLFF